MMPVPAASAIAALTALLRVTVNVSLPSNVVSPMTGTVMVSLMSPGAKFNVPLVVV